MTLASALRGIIGPVPTPAERQALLFVAAVAALGVGVRACRALDRAPVDASSRAALAGQLSRVDSAIAAGGARRTARPPSAARADEESTRRARTTPRPRAADTLSSAGSVVTPVDVDRASAEQLDALPGIGPALAARIVADREQRGPFGSLEALDGVKGIGPALAERLRPHVTFSAPPRPHDTEVPAARRRRHP